MIKIAGRDVATSDVGTLAGGAVVFVASFLPWMRVDWYYYRGVSHIGWACGFFAVVAIVFSMGVTGLVAARIFGNVRVPPVGPVGPASLNVIIGALATLFVLLRLFTVSPYDPGFGIYCGLVGAAALTGFSVLGLRASGESPEAGSALVVTAPSAPGAGQDLAPGQPTVDEPASPAGDQS
jgi:hypothetical protein